MASPNAPREVLVIQNDPDGGPKRWGDWLGAAGLRLDVCHAYDGRELPERLRHDALVVLGGGLLPDADERAGWLPATRELIRQACDTATPMLGICLGGQMLAHVAGGKVEGDVGAPENGSTPIRIRDEARQDPLFGDLPGTVTAIEHHVDAVTRLPESAVWLAETDACPYQAFRVGSRAWGVQFHPEVPAERIKTWDPESLRRQGFDRDELYERALTDEPAAAPVWEAFAARFAAIVQRPRLPARHPEKHR